MNVKVNKRLVSTQEEIRLKEFIGQFRSEPDSVIAILNDSVIPRNNWAQTVLRDNDDLELVGIVGGG